MDAESLVAVEPRPVTTKTKFTVLCVDDDHSTRKLLSRMLGMAECDCHTAANGAEALEVLEELGDIDLVVTDFCMPVMDGGELCEAIERLHPGVKVVVISGSHPEILSSFRTNPQVLGVLEKPVQRVDFLSIIYSALEAG